MNTSLEATIREHLLRYLAGDLTLQEFEDWFVPATWNQIGRVPLSTERLIGEIELRIAEFTSGHRPEDEVREFLARALTHIVLNAPPYLVDSMESTIIRQRAMVLLPGEQTAALWTARVAASV
jgi:hypothetical protein